MGQCPIIAIQRRTTTRALSERGERYSELEGKTPVITVKQSGKLLQSIETAGVIELRDKPIIAMLIYSAARVGAVARLKEKDLHDATEQYCLIMERISI